jgi:hypothetical protein
MYEESLVRLSMWLHFSLVMVDVELRVSALPPVTPRPVTTVLRFNPTVFMLVS